MRMPEVMIAILLVLLLASCKEEKLARGETAPALAAFDLQGKPASLERWEGKAVYLNFWSASCGGCLAEMDTLQALSQRWPDKLVVVGVNTDPEQVDIAPLLAKHGISYPVLRDQLHITQDRYQVIGTPTSIVIDARGRARDLHQGWRKPEELQAVFTRLAQSE
ncbi:TlpA family protein disulfide reductase [Raoultella ornithinolytica]|uniref:TlpA family protein disulfide reductase n=1 Tax=Raoultella ornithinolytica TaxID=54291 RepID=UPI000CF3186D|nr:TlpA disulfide reductase family protein [Raoultella ornithinolytica]PQH32179.1 thioredoxin [Raoultella ornithinolytica]QQO49428.1 TlpA family protein disulfide reductase [Raoultella ornithinolytica]UIZ73648.1 TlpA family protein disulfide reductase [Raoultella ornithinolytica]VEC79559.1 Thiol-disulfide oxidoreductase resA [Raoultella ornithinolytica]HEC2578429.1 TlpA family protein disulfide reductase [Raoultella ornithinolytica]